MSIKPDTTSPYAQPPQYGNRSPGLSGEVGDEEEPPQPAFSYLVGHTPDQLYGNVSPTEHHSGTFPPGSSNTLSPNGPREDWLPPLQAGGNVKRGLPRHTFSDVGQSNPGFNPNEYIQIDNGRHNSTGNLPPNQGGQAPGDVGCYATTGRGQPRNSNYPSEFTAVGPNPADRKTGHYDGFTDRQTGHYEAFPGQTTAAVDIGMNDMSPSANGPGDDRYEAVGYPSDSMKRNRGMRPTTKQSHLGKLSSVSEEPPREPPKYGCLCIFAIVVAVVVALAAGFAAGWFLHGTGATGGATTATLVQTSTIRTTPTSKPTTTTTTTTMTISTAAPPPSTPDTLTTSTPHVTTAKQTMASTITTSEAAKQTTAATTATTEATTTPQTTTAA